MKPIALNMVAEIARHHETRGLPISASAASRTWRDAAEFMALGAGNVQVCTAAMTYGFKIVQEMISGLSQYLDEKEMALSDLVGPGRSELRRMQDLNLNYVTKAGSTRMPASSAAAATPPARIRATRPSPSSRAGCSR